MQLQIRINFMLRAWLLLCLASFCISTKVNAQRTSEKQIQLLSNATTLVDEFATANVLNVQIVGQSGLDFQINTPIVGGNFQIEVQSNSALTGLRNFTLEYETQGNPNPLKNYRIYYLNFSTSLVKAHDDLINWDGNGSLTIDVLGNDEISGLHSLKINQKNSAASVFVSNNQIQYSNANFDGLDYIHYTIKDSTGTSDQAIVKIEFPQSVPTADESKTFYINYLSTKDIAVPSGFNIAVHPQNGSIDELDATHFVYAPQSYFIGTDSFIFENNAGIRISYHAHILDAERDPGIVKNDIFYTAKGQSVTFDVFANDMTNIFAITSYSNSLSYDTMGVFTFTPVSTFTGQKNFFYKINNGNGVETGSITIHVGNHSPIQDILYTYDVLANKDFVIEYDVPLEGYHFEIIVPPVYGNAYAYVDSTDLLTCGKVVGKAMIVYSAPSAGAVDSMNIRYCVNNQCKTYKLVFTSHTSLDPLCNCTDDCVWAGDLNADGRVNGSDLMVLGRYFGYVGPERFLSGENIWTGEFVDDWGIKAINGKDIKYADANGDGTLDQEDVAVIDEHFGRVNNLVPTEQLAYKDFQLTMVPDQEEYEIGDTATIYIYLGTQVKPANGIHGLSFGMDVDSTGYLDVKYYNTSWLADHSPLIEISKLIEDRKIRTAVSRTRGKGSSGFGLIGQLSIIIEESDGVRQGEEQNYFTKNLIVDNIECEDGEGNKFLLEPTQISFRVNKKVTEIPSIKEITIFPNPTDKVFFIIADKNEIIHQISLTNMLGNTIVNHNNINSFEHQLDLSTIPSGVYLLKVHTDKGVVSKTVVKR